MSQHTIEAQHLKKNAIDKILTQMYGYIDDEKAGKKISSSNKPKMYLRMARLLAGTDDSVFIDTIDNLLAKNATGDEIKNALRGISERKIPQGLKRVMSDRLHHGIPLELMDVLMKQEPNVMLEFLQAAEADGRYFGDSRPNIDNSFQEQSHTAAADKATAKYENHPYELNLRGDRRFSAHPDGTNKGFDKALDQVYGSGSEMYDAFKPAIAEAEYALKLGINSDKSRRVVANELVIKEGIVKPGGDLWAKDTPEFEIIAGRAHLAKREVGLQVAASHNPYKFQDPKDLAANNITPAMVDEWDKGQLKKLKLIQDAIENPLAKRAAGMVPFVGTGIGAALVENITTDREKEIAENPNDPTLQVNKVLDQVSGWGDRTSLAGMAATATGFGAPAGVPAVAVGEAVSGVASTMSMAIDGGRAYLKFITDKKEVTEEELDFAI